MRIDEVKTFVSRMTCGHAVFTAVVEDKVGDKINPQNYLMIIGKDPTEVYHGTSKDRLYWPGADVPFQMGTGEIS